MAAKENRPDFECAAFVAQKPALDKIRHVLSGTDAVKAEGVKYLPKGPLETIEAYEARLKTAVLYPATQRTWTGAIGALFAEGVCLGQDVPEQIRGVEADDETKEVEGWAENIDNAGNSLNVFVQALAGDAFADGHAAVLVEMPPAVQRADGLPPTLADEQNAGLRPYWIKYTKDQIINWREEYRNGKTVLALVVIKECVTVPDGDYGEREVERYREFRNDGGVVTVTVKEKVANAKDTDAEFITEMEPTVLSKQAAIPIAACYGHKLGTFQSKPPLMGIAEQNLRHYELGTWLRKFIALSFPMTVTKGELRNFNTPDGAQQDIARTAEDILQIDANPDTNVFLLEPKGTGIEPTFREIEKCEERMAALGASILKPGQQSGKTVVEAASDQEQERAVLDYLRTSVEDCVEQLLMFTAAYIGEKTGGSFDIETASDRYTLSPEMLRILSDMVTLGQFALKDLLMALKESGELPEAFNVDNAIAAIMAEQAAAQERQQAAFDAGLGA